MAEIALAEPAVASAPARNVVYPVGFFGILFFTTLFTQWIVYFHAPPGTAPGGQPGGAAGASPALAAMLLAGWVLQGLLNPIIGIASDRWGRKRPFILLGTVPLAAAFYALWIPSSHPLELGRILVYSAILPFVVQPYISLLPSIATSEAARLKLTLVGSVLGLVAAGAALIGGAAIIEAAGFRGIGLAGAAALVLTIFLPALLVKEPIASPASSRSRFGFAQTRDLIRSGPLAAFLVANFFLLVAVTALTMISPFVTEAIIGRDRNYNVVVNGFLFTGMILSIPLLGALAKRHSHLRILQAGTLAGAVCAGLGAAASFASGGAPVPLWWALFFGLGFPSLASVALPPLILSPIADREGRGSDGLIFGLNGLAVNFGCAAGAGLTTVLLRMGRSADDPDGVRAALVACAALLAAASFFVARALRMART